MDAQENKDRIERERDFHDQVFAEGGRERALKFYRVAASSQRCYRETLPEAQAFMWGPAVVETPNIDRLAASGMRFTDGYAACAVCSPTRAAVMTGRYPARLGVTDWIRARFQGGDIPQDKKNPTEYVGGRNRKLRRRL